jgi:hypothetical protein
MNMLRTLTASLLVLCAPCVVQASTLFTNPVIVVTPTTLDFGRVATNATATSTFLVENFGSGRLVGTVTVAAPFKILSGGNYNLKENEAQLVTVIYKPTGTAPDSQTVQFTGAGGATATVIGKPTAPPPKPLKRR